VSDTPVIEFEAQVWAIKTLVDGGLQFVFAVSEDKTMQAAQLMECKRYGAMLKIQAVTLINKQEQEQENDVGKRTKRKSGWKTA